MDVFFLAVFTYYPEQYKFIFNMPLSPHRCCCFPKLFNFLLSKNIPIVLDNLVVTKIFIHLKSHKFVAVVKI
jgi:hypothetical protein